MGYGTHHLADVATHCTHTHTHTSLKTVLSTGLVESVRSGQSGAGLLFFPLSFLLLLLLSLSFSFVLKGSDIYIYILGILLFIFFQRKVYTGKNKGNCFFLLLLLLHPNSSSIHQGVSSSCLRAHTHNTRTSLLPINASTLPFPQPPFFFFLPFLILYFVWRKPYPTTVSLNKSIIFYKKK